MAKSNKHKQTPTGDIEVPVTNGKACQNCNFHTEGVGAITDNGTIWKWQDCSKGWGKPSPVGVLKNLCGTYQPKKDLVSEIS